MIVVNVVSRLFLHNMTAKIQDDYGSPEGQAEEG